jgi:hypothetical protein
MSQANVERLRAFAEEDVLARRSGEFDLEVAISKQAALWDQGIELDTPEAGLNLAGFTGALMLLGSGGESGTRRGKPSDLSTKDDSSGRALYRANAREIVRAARSSAERTSGSGTTSPRSCAGSRCARGEAAAAAVRLGIAAQDT